MDVSVTGHDFQEDIEAISRNRSVPTLLETALLATGMGFSAVARVTDARWVTCQVVDRIAFGLKPGDELQIESTLCHEVRQFDQEIVINDVLTDPLYVYHHCPARYGFRSYISVPIRRANGEFFGTLCAIDPNPNDLKNDRVLSMFRLFAKLIGEGLDADEELIRSRTELTHEREMAQVQEQFIAVLAHDLRNPIHALSAGLRMLERREIDAKATELVLLMKSAAHRMGLLIENLLDQARKRSGADFLIERTTTEDLGPTLTQIVREFRTVAPDQPMNIDIDLNEPVDCDVPRIGQLFSNLLANAITHGKASESIDVSVRIVGDKLVLTISNQGERIPQDRMETLFLPFERGSNRQGLGLGLFIASEIAKGHDGTLTVTSSDEMTTFTLEMPKRVA
ncbi:Bacteriophytochrome [Flavimaricola marinus]|uniref:histidine kinase n=2 Tax=Flavimaricola marinus TaxID=1819565 RepID=A0A238LDT3_9RHOB|nr:Bacteriophytochrome [Flavimaricola marinus]